MIKKMTTCPICKDKKWQWYFNGLERCLVCGLIRSIPPIEKGFYDSLSEAKKQFEKVADFERYARELLDYLDTPRGSLLDIGAGTGFLVAEANKRGFSAMGVEPSKVYATVGRKKLRVKLQVSSFEGFRTKKKFDVVVLKHVIEHVEDLNGFLAKCQALLKPTGVLLISCPNIRSLMFYLFGSRWYGLQLGQHCWQFSPESLGKLLKKNGFKKVRKSVISLDYKVKGWKRPVFWFLLSFAKLTGLGDQLVVVAN